ncbi:DUF4236 domain-containing protein [Pedobacter sp. G11]|uniref:DUF4236 domain-containing protein n=1 Tax=Pedobacter sp. G11 TaxID=2482728 RepID=UPI000F5DA00A|nr:DUF4236 domain-containing protein [Pedobacter sp. G11]AZI26671.1 DUF4236 domain-containing protein [Pedobacter sp. G11]
MGLFFRKSVSFGGLRINFSNSEVSYSAGVRGARISKGRKGTYVTMGAHGIYYRQRIGKPVNRNPLTVPVSQPDMHTITSGDIDQLTDVDSRVFIDELSEKAAKLSLTTWLGIWPMIIFVIVLLVYSIDSKEVIVNAGGLRKVAVIHSEVGLNIRSLPDAGSTVLKTASDAEQFTLLDESDKKWLKIGFNDSVGYVSKKLARVDSVEDPREVRDQLYLTNPYYFWMLGSGLLGFAGLIYSLIKLDRKRLSMELYYEMDNEMAKVYDSFSTQFAAFNASKRKWQYLHAQRNHDWKRNAGAGKLINRVGIDGVDMHQVPVKFFKTNVQIPHIKLRNTDLFFLPERLLVRRANKFAAVFYKNLVIDHSTTRFIEDEAVASDARIVDYTWKYVNKSGGPDRRFSNNHQIPICLYSEYTLRSVTGVNEVICTSKIGAFDGFGSYLKQIGRFQSAIRISG